VSDEALARRMGQLTLRTAAGVDPGPVTEQEWAIFTAFIRDAVVSWQEAGVLPPPMHVLDLRWADATVLWARARAVDAAMNVLRRWWPQAGSFERPLQDVLKSIPRDDAARVVTHLRVAFPDLDLEPPGDDA
jgi:hypothetical protein